MGQIFRVRFINETHDIDDTLDCADDTAILDVAEEAQLDLPYSCRAGACSSCAGRIIKGKVNQEDQTFLDDDQVGHGFILTCVAFPMTDLEVHCHAEDDIF
ncbi:unnamed protein product [Pylaiella littoralis]